MRRALLAALGAVLRLAACAQPTPAAESIPVVQARQLATVYISPTPDAAAQAATRAAARPTDPAPVATVAPSPTVYVGVFLAPVDDESGPFISLEPETIAAGGPTPIPANCGIPIGEAFVAPWTETPEIRRALACPIEGVITFEGAVQVFERGVMYFEPNGFIWAIAPSFTQGIAGRHWVLDAIPDTVAGEPIEAPEGLRVPQFGFGAVWRSVDGVRAALGFARTEEQPIRASYQRFTGGILLADLSVGQIYALTADNQVYGPF